VRAYKPRLFLVTPTHGTARDRPAVEHPKGRSPAAPEATPASSAAR